MQADLDAEIDCNYSHEPKKGARGSPIWNTFHLIFNSDGDEVDGFYFCIKCTKVVYSPHTVLGNTSQLLRHACVSKESSNFTINANEFDRLKRDAAKMVSLDLRPLKSVECPGLLDLVMDGVSLGKKYPDMTIDDLKKVFPTRNTVKSTLKSEAKIAKDSIKALFQKAIENGGFGCTLDLWSDNYKYRSYLAMTANMFLLEGDAIVQKRIVFEMTEIDEIVKSKAVIRQKIIDVFADFGLSEEDIKNYVTFTTDRYK